jgi:hypothetical protein
VKHMKPVKHEKHMRPELQQCFWLCNCFSDDFNICKITILQTMFSSTNSSFISSSSELYKHKFRTQQ